MEVGDVAAADLEEGHGVRGRCWGVAADEDGGVWGEEGANAVVLWVEGVGGGEEALEEEEAGGCGGWDRFRGAVVDGDGCVHLGGESWSWPWIYRFWREISAAF